MFAKFEQLLEEQRSRYFLWVPVFLGAGAGSYFSFQSEPDLPIWGWGMLLSICLLGAIRLKRTSAKLVLGAFFLAFLGLALATLRANLIAAPVLSEVYFGAVEGRIVKLDRSQSNRLRITLDQLQLYGLEPEEIPKRVRVTLPQKKASAQVGERIMIYSRLEGPGAPVEPGGFDFRRWAWFHRLGGVGYALGPQMQAFKEADTSIAVRVALVRYRLADLIRARIPEEEGAFAAAILTGERSGIDPKSLEDLRASNLAHLLAISGLHMGLLTGFIFGMFRYGIAAASPLGLTVNAKKIGALAAIPAGLAYLILSGASIATQRAYIMVLVILIAVLLDRPAFTLRAVALAALVILVIAPESVTQVGFQMSFAATIGLVAGFELLRHSKLWKIPVSGWRKLVKGAFSVAFSSAVAGAATAPFAAYHFNQFAQYGLVANLFAVPLMGFLVMPALIVALILEPIGLSALFFWLGGLGISGILYIAQTVSGWEGAVRLVASGTGPILPIFAFGCLVLVLWLGRLRFLGFGLMGVGVVLWMNSERPSVLIDESGKLVGIMTSEGRSMNKPRGGGFSANSWLENDGDPKSQKEAAFRQVAEAQVAILKGKSSDQMQRLCALNQVVVAPDGSFAPSQSCTIVDKDMLERNGAIALHFHDDKIEVHGSKLHSGDRLWTR